MFKTTSTFDKLLDKATSNLLLEPDWPSIMQICDLIRQNDVQPKYAIMSIKKKLYNPNPHCAMYALQVMESIVKNCGTGVHEELTSKQNCEMLRELAKTSQHENVRAKVLELIQAWTFAFRKSTKYRALKDTMNIMKTEGFKFPTLRETDAMFSADNAPEWTDGDVCHRCRVAFGFVQRKHHCRACGQVFCGQCSQKTTTLPKFGIEKEVRVCDACFEQATKPVAAAPTTADAKTHDSDLPAEYLASSLAQQNQAPPRKTEEELREEEELQLALALSKSEAEEKEKEKLRVTSAVLSNPESHRSPVNNTPRSLSPPPEEQTMDPELARYLNRTYWETRQKEEAERPASPSAPSPMSTASSVKQQVNGIPDPEMDDFVQTLKSQVEIFVNRMKSNSSRGRSIANDSSVQTLFMNITAMHSRLLRYIQQQDDSRLYYEGLQDKLVQIKDARAALDALREEHCEKLRRQAEEAERQRQLQMAHKLDIMRKKKQEYLQYQRQLALQRIQEQEREMQMRQEQQKQQYLMGSQYPYIGSPVHGAGQQYGAMNANMYYHQYNPVMGVPQGPPQGPSGPGPSMPMGVPVMHQPQGGQSQAPIPMGMPPQQVNTSQTPPNSQLPPNMHQMQPPAAITSIPQAQPPLQQPSQAGQMPNQPTNQLPPGLGMPPVAGLPPSHALPGVSLPNHGVMSAPNIGMSSQAVPVMQNPVVNSMSGQHIPTGMTQQPFQPILSPPQQPNQPKPENTVAELISFD